jgi:cell division GTPase FtsZ
MDYLQQFTDAEDAEIFLGHVTKDNEEGEVRITILAAGMDPNAAINRPAEVFVTSTPSQPRQEPVGITSAPITMDEIDLDIPAFLRRQKLGGG